MVAAIRFSRRETSWDDNVPLADVVRQEFRKKDGASDLRPSVYRLEPKDSRIQAYAEHVANAGIDPPKAALAIDLSTCNRPLDASPSPLFSFLNRVHAEFDLRNETELHDLIDCGRSAMRSSRTRITQAEINDYACAKFQANDAEWINAHEQKPS